MPMFIFLSLFSQLALPNDIHLVLLLTFQAPLFHKSINIHEIRGKPTAYTLYTQFTGVHLSSILLIVVMVTRCKH